jgi:uncharacterized membrane protein YhaH (DUF805 family)
MFSLFNILVVIALLILSWVTADSIGPLFMLLYYLYAIAIVIPSLAVTVRRLHDIDKSGFWYFINFVPLIGGIWLLILTCMEGTGGENSYGPDPKVFGA